MIKELESYGFTVQIKYAYANPEEVKQHYNVVLINLKNLKQTDAIIFAVLHVDYLEIGWNLFYRLHHSNLTLVFDVKGNLKREDTPVM